MSNLSAHRKKIILIAVLDWGLGHATRCMPLIRELQRQHYQIVVAGSGTSLQLLKEEFPAIPHEEIAGYRISYPFDNMILNMAIQAPRIIAAIIREHFQIRTLHQKYHFDGVISDNRYGCFLRGVRSVFMGHQLHILTPYKWLTRLVNLFHHKWLRRFDEVWIPDIPNGLSGTLSKTRWKNTRHIGLLSRMKPLDVSPQYDLVAILSGVEPQRTKLENILRLQLQKLDIRVLLVQGIVTKDNAESNTANIRTIPYLTSEKLNTVMAAANIILCRPGYSSLMDLAVLKKKAVVIPTPGQTEQEYLGAYLHKRKMVVCQRQEEVNIAAALDEIRGCSGLAAFINQPELLERAIRLTMTKDYS